jgi:DNA-binding IclR family transcriptional regulator
MDTFDTKGPEVGCGTSAEHGSAPMRFTGWSGPEPVAERGDSSGDRLLAVLALFTVERPEWTVEAAAARIGVSATTTYRYFKRLTNCGLISPVSRASYTLGPAIIQMDRQIQLSDPMLRAARSIMQDLIGYGSERSLLLLCRLFHDRVMCVHQVFGSEAQVPVSFERGRPMPLFRSATSKIILAHLPTRALKSVFAESQAEIRASGLGSDWDEFRRTLTGIRRAGHHVTCGEVDPGRVGIAAPVFDREKVVLGSLSFVLPADEVDDTLLGRLIPLTIAGAREIERAMRDESATKPSPARLRVAR